MRILHVFGPSFERHGHYARRSSAILREQRGFGWSTVHVTAPGQRRRHLGGGWQCYLTRPVPPALAAWPWLSRVGQWQMLRKRLRDIIGMTRPDLIHAHSPAWTTVASLGLGVPVVSEWRGLVPEDAQNVHCRVDERLALQRAHGFVVCSEAMRREMGRFVRDERPVIVVPDAWEPDDDDETGDMAAAPAGGPIIGFIGPLDEWAGPQMLLAALPALALDFPGVSVIMAGMGADAGPLLRQARELGVAPRLHLVQCTEEKALHDYLPHLDVLAYPTLHQRAVELLPPVRALPAMARGALIAASDVGGQRELFEHGKTAVMFSAGHVPSLVACLRALLAQPNRWHHLRHNARHFALSKHNWNTSAASYKSMIQNLVAKNKRAPMGSGHGTTLS